MSFFRALVVAFAPLLAFATAAPIAEAQTSFDRGAFATGVDSLAEAFLADGPVAGVTIAVQKDGEIILAKGYGLAELEHSVPMTVESIHRIGSISKQFVAVAILQLVEQGKVRLDDPITRFVPDYPARGDDITVHHLLTHTSGIRNYTAMGPAFWDQSTLDLTHEEMVQLFGTEPLDFEPGEKWNYSNSGYYLLGMIVEKATETAAVSLSEVHAETAEVGGPSAESIEPGLPTMQEAADSPSYAEYLDEHIFGPLGMTGSSYCDETEILPNRAQGYDVQDGELVNDQPLSMALPGAAGALCSNVLDMMRWQRALEANTLIGAESRRLMLTEATLDDGSGTDYAYGLGLGDLEGRAKVSHGGGINGFTTMHATYPDDDLVVTVFANTASSPGFLESQIARLALGLPLVVVLDLPTDDIDLDRYAGTYAFEALEMSVEVIARDGQLFLSINGSENRLRYQGDDTFGWGGGQFLAFSPEEEPATVELRAPGQTFEGVRQGS